MYLAQPLQSSGAPSPRRRRRPMRLGLPLGMLAAAAGLAGVSRMTLPEADPVDPATALKVEVVQPTARPFDPGPRMDVGELVDGYEPRPIPATGDPYADPFGEAAVYAVAWLGPTPPLPSPYRVFPSDRARQEPPAWPTAPRSGERTPANPYGFDTPRPDYAAARRAREARLARLEAERHAGGATAAGRTEREVWLAQVRAARDGERLPPPGAPTSDSDFY